MCIVYWVHSPERCIRRSFSLLQMCLFHLHIYWFSHTLVFCQYVCIKKWIKSSKALFFPHSSTMHIECFVQTIESSHILYGNQSLWILLQNSMWTDDMKCDKVFTFAGTAQNRLLMGALQYPLANPNIGIHWYTHTHARTHTFRHQIIPIFIQCSII